jgi:Family of unknown function (DUF6492)
MPNDNLRRRPLDIATACRAADLSSLRLALGGLRRFVPFKRLHVMTARSNFARSARALGADVELLDEDSVIPGMTLAELRKLSLPGFPRGAGWYFQQLLKFAFCFRKQEDDYYLIWDADTVPLRPMEFFDDLGRMLFTIAEEQHRPYFQTYRTLFRQEPNYDFSFISQHMIVQKSILREMLVKIEANLPGRDSWAWKIVKNLQGTSSNLFSEYETLGHYVKNNYPSRAAYRKLNWLREGSLQIRGRPSRADLEQFGRTYDFVAFELRQMRLRRFVRRARAWLKYRRE